MPQPRPADRPSRLPGDDHRQDGAARGRLLISMMLQAGIRRLLPLVAFWGYLLLAPCCLWLEAQEGQSNGSAQNATPQNETDTSLAAAREYFRKGSFDQAIAKYKEALQAGRQPAEAYAGIVRSYLKQEKLQEAAETLEKGLQAQPADSSLKEAQAELLFRQGKIPDTERKDLGPGGQCRRGSGPSLFVVSSNFYRLWPLRAGTPAYFASARP